MSKNLKNKIKCLGIVFLMLLGLLQINDLGCHADARDLDRNLSRTNHPRIAMITWRGETRAEAGFVDGLSRFGYVPKITKYHCDQNTKRLVDVLNILEPHPPDLIYVFGTTATKAVVRRIASCPVIFDIVTRPVESGIIANWQSSGNNATGVSSMVPIMNQIRTLKKVISFSKLGVVYNPLEQNSLIQFQLLSHLAISQKFKLIPFEITRAEDIQEKLNNLEEFVDAVYLPSDSMIKSLGKDIMARVNRQNMPSLAALEEMVIHDGALMGLVPDYYQLGGLAARTARLVLEGRRPSEIPVVTSDHFNITVNLKTAQAIGINIPTDILVMADRIIR